MASNKNHQEQENIIPDLRQKQGTVMAAQQKRPVLGVIDHNKPNNNVAKGKQVSPQIEAKAPTTRCVTKKLVLQPLKAVKKAQNVGAPKDDLNENKKNLVAPVVPVAQFEAFKVYEDDEYMARIDQKLRLLSKSNVYKGTAEDRFITKTELAEREKKRIIEKNQEIENEAPVQPPTQDQPVPMSITKANDENQIILKNVSRTKDLFFEVDEYRDDIYAYLREHEVSSKVKPVIFHIFLKITCRGRYCHYH